MQGKHYYVAEQLASVVDYCDKENIWGQGAESDTVDIVGE